MYFSPLETETVRRKRAEQFGLTPPPKDPYLHNQSLPYPLKYPENGNSNLDMGESRKCTIDKFKGIGIFLILLKKHSVLFIVHINLFLKLLELFIIVKSNKHFLPDLTF